MAEGTFWVKKRKLLASYQHTCVPPSLSATHFSQVTIHYLVKQKDVSHQSEFMGNTLS